MNQFSLSKKNGLITLFGLISIISLFACHQTSKISYFSGSLEEAFSKAKAEHKKVFLLMSDKGCNKCQAFSDFLDTQKETVEMLSDGYVCVKPDAHSKRDHKYFEILKTPSYPFPYFFDTDGTLLAFGFPNDKEFNIKDLKKIGLSEFFFKETFDMDISTEEYKALISKSLKATLLLNGNPDSSEKAFELYCNSADIFVYPFNLRNIHLLSVRLGKPEIYETFKSKYRKSPKDLIIYGELEEYRFLKNIDNKLVLRPKDVVKLDRQDINLGNLQKDKGKIFFISFTNISDKPLVISKVEHPCDCIKFKWTSKTVPPHGSDVIEGTFTPYASGPFTKEIYIHTSSPAEVMVKANITGTVK